MDVMRLRSKIALETMANIPSVLVHTVIQTTSAISQIDSALEIVAEFPNLGKKNP